MKRDIIATAFALFVLVSCSKDEKKEVEITEEVTI